MAKRYRGRQRMVSEAIFESADFDGISFVGTTVYVGLLIQSDDGGRVCIDPEWVRRRLCHRRGINRVTTHRIGQCIGQFIERGIITRCPPPSSSRSSLSYGQLSLFHHHNKIFRPEDETRQDETMKDQEGARARGASVMPSKPESAPPSSRSRSFNLWKEVRREDLEDPNALERIHDAAAARGWFKPTERTRQAVPGLAQNCLRFAKNPVRAFVWRLRSRKFDWQSDSDEERGLSLKQARSRARREHEREDTG